MKNLKKFIVPGLILLFILVIYTSYFAPGDELGDFSTFDPNNNANKDIRVEIVRDKGVRKDMASGSSIFYVKDKNGVEVMVQGPIELPPTFEMNDVFTLKGHLHKDYFHATEILAK
ncbi:MAG: cytochrome c maturation protein CcmE [Ignavibacteriaceae bacterium]|nr:cytochrome c maturation protein CcmE [Ignavibacteriaceae bacterium]